MRGVGGEEVKECVLQACPFEGKRKKTDKPREGWEVFGRGFTAFLAFLLPAKGASKPTQPQVLTVLTVV